MPRKPTPPEAQAERTNVSLYPDAKADLERLRDEVPGVESISAAIRHAARVAVAHLDEPKNGKRK